MWKEWTGKKNENFGRTSRDLFGWMCHQSQLRLNCCSFVNARIVWCWMYGVTPFPSLSLPLSLSLSLYTPLLPTIWNEIIATNLFSERFWFWWITTTIFNLLFADIHIMSQRDFCSTPFRIVSAANRRAQSLQCLPNKQTNKRINEQTNYKINTCANKLRWSWNMQHPQ